MKRRTFCLGAILAAVLSLPALAEATWATLYKNPQCSCCEGYAAYLRQNGFDVDVRPTNDLAEISQKAGVPEDLQGCHTMFVDGYVVDGHVPVNVISEASVGAARDRRDHSPGNAKRIAGHDRSQAGPVHDLRRQQGRQAARDLCGRIGSG